MKFNKVENMAIGETLYFGTHESGLGIFVVPKKNFSKKYAIIGAKIGPTAKTNKSPFPTELRIFSSIKCLK